MIGIPSLKLHPQVLLYNMRTRSQFDGEHKMLPYYEEPDWVHLSELYHAEKNNLLEICLEKKFTTEEKTAQKWESLRPAILKKRCHERLLYSIMHAKTPLCAFMEDIPDHVSLTKLSMYMDKGYQWIQRVRFRHARSHVHGVCDGVIAVSLLTTLSDVKGLEDLDDEAPYLVVIIKPSLERNPGQHALEMAATLHYFRNGDERLSEKWVLVIGKANKMFLYPVENHHHREVHKHLQRIRKVKKWASLIDLNEDLPLAWQPNMNLSSTVWGREKQEMGRRLGDITLLWCCSDEHRQRAFAQGITSWRDPAFTPEIMGFTDPTKISILRRIVEVNRSTDPSGWLLVDPCLPQKFPEVMEETITHLFVDFEYTTDNLIYLVGVWDGTNYTAFWAEDLTEASVANMWASFQTFLDRYESYQCWFWYAEVKMMQKTGVSFQEDRWTDLWALVRAGVAVRGAFDFGLKSFVKAFYEHGRMPFRYDDLECQDGLASLAMAESYYQTWDVSQKESLEKYNRYDCVAMGHILQAIREKL